jgi:PRTRC genetic system protein C
MARIFIYENKEYPDPDPALSVEEVRQSMANFFPELSNSETKEIKNGDNTVYTFSKRVGTKGGASTGGGCTL